MQAGACITTRSDIHLTSEPPYVGHSLVVLGVVVPGHSWVVGSVMVVVAVCFVGCIAVVLGLMVVSVSVMVSVVSLSVSCVMGKVMFLVWVPLVIVVVLGVWFV